MTPAQPPLPSPTILPFHPVCGIQTSTLMSESEFGVSVAATRQNAGIVLNASAAGAPPPARPGPPGPRNWPAAIASASVIFTFIRLSLDNASQEPPSAAPSDV